MTTPDSDTTLNPDQSTPGAFVVAALYRFTPLPDFEDRRAPLEAIADAKGVRGTLLLADEGINGTIAGTREAIDAIIGHIRKFPGCADLDVKDAHAATMPFTRLKVRLKREIVTMGVPGIDPTKTVGTYVDPENWNALVSQPDTVLIDTRNDYEVAIGTFAGAVNPQTETFREFPAWARAMLAEARPKRVAMFCTGGIRCEKATALMKEMGLDEVYHLKGGILKYLETVPPEDSLWQGECFVFDRRVSVGHGLEPGPYQLCSACREPFLTGEGRGGYAAAVCPRCQSEADSTTKARAAERQRQIDLAKSRGQSHLGPSQNKQKA